MRRHASRRSLVLLLLPVLAACGGGTSAGDGLAVRDSAGVVIVEARRADGTAALDEWLVEPAPSLEIGLIEGDAPYLFANIEGARLLEDGGVAVADRGSAQLRFFDADGRFLRAAGGHGEGPGEFSYVRGVDRCGADSLYVYDLDFRTVVFSADGRYAREARPWGPAAPERRPYLLRCNENGYFAAVGWDRSPHRIPAVGEPPILYRAEAPAWILEPLRQATASARRDDFAGTGLRLAAELEPVLTSERLANPRGTGPHPLGRGATMAMDASGLWIGTGEAHELRRYSLDGTLARILRWNGDDLAVTAAHIEGWHAAELERGNAARRASIAQTLRDSPVPAALPAFVRIEIDPEGMIWIQPFHSPGSAAPAWIVLDPDRGPVARVTMPEGLRVTDIRTDALVGVHRDDLGVERVRVHRVGRGG
jgi:hypothetical protein